MLRAPQETSGGPRWSPTPPAAQSTSTAGTAWAGLGTFAGALVIYSMPGGIILDQTTGLFGQERGFFGDTLLTAGKAIIAYDTWGEDPQRAAGMTVFNVVSAVVGTKGAGAGLRGAGAAAQGSRFATVVRVGNGFTRWVDGQFALDRPELGLSNWEHGRLLGRSGILSGDSVYTVRTRATQSDPDLHR